MIVIEGELITKMKGLNIGKIQHHSRFINILLKGDEFETFS